MQQRLTSTDIALIKELEIDSRRSSSVLASTLGISEATVRRRIQRLIEHGIISVVAIPSYVGSPRSKILAILGVNVARGQVDTVADELISCHSVQAINYVTGRYNILIWVASNNWDDLWRFITEEVSAIEGVASIEIMPAMRLIKTSFAVLGNNYPHSEPQEQNWDVDEIDVTLIRELERDGLQGTVKLAKNLGLSIPTVKKRIQRLLETQTIKVVCFGNPRHLGYQTSAAIFLKVNPKHIKAASDELASFLKTQMVLAIAGPYDLVVWAIFKDTNALLNYVRLQLDTITGVISYEILVSLKQGKFSLRLASWLFSSDEA